VDVRFKEEFDAWHLGDAINLPLNELPRRMGELDKNKLIITACPHKDRAAMARLYLVTKGFQVRYLEDGLLSLAEYLRGDRARDFMNGRQR
jgi:rhodanese-related sulfurtransferase